MIHVINYGRVQTVIEIHIFDVIVITAHRIGDLDLNRRQNNHKQIQHVHISVIFILIDLSQFIAHHGCYLCMLQYIMYMGVLLKKILPRRVSYTLVTLDLN